MKTDPIHLLRRGFELSQAAYRYAPIIRLLENLARDLAGQEFGKKLDPRLHAEMKRVLEEEIQPETQRVWEQFAALFGFAWQDRIRVRNRGQKAVELKPTVLYCRPDAKPPYGVLMGQTLKRNGEPSRKILETKLIVGVTKVEVLPESKSATHGKK